MKKLIFYFVIPVMVLQQNIVLSQPSSLPWPSKIRSPRIYSLGAHLWNAVQQFTPNTWDVIPSDEWDVEMAIALDGQLWAVEDFVWEPGLTNRNTTHTFEGYGGSGSSLDCDIFRIPLNAFFDHFEPGHTEANTYVHFYAGGSGAWVYADTSYASYRVELYADPAPHFVGY